MTNAASHKRVNDTVLGPLERPALQWLATRMPAWVTPDHLTFLGVIGGIIVAVSFALTAISPAYLWLASFGVFLNWFGDSLDGTLARYRHIERPRYGFFVDHIVDSFVETLIFLGIGFSPYVRLEFAEMALIAYLSVTIYVFLYTYVSDVFKISYGKLGPTEARALLILANMLIFFVGNPVVNLPASIGPMNLYDLFVLVVTVILFYIFFSQSYVTARRLSAEDREAARLKKKQEKASKQIARPSRKSRKAAKQTGIVPGKLIE